MSENARQQSPITFRHYLARDLETCLALFDANCPQFFAPGERADYAEFLAASHDGYTVVLADEEIVGAFGLTPLGVADSGVAKLSLNWILLSPDTQGQGVGRAVMEKVLRSAQETPTSTIAIAASHLSAPFFARFGAQELAFHEHGWGPDMHRVDMEIGL